MGDQGLSRLYFGRDDAELDITEGGLLRAGFLPTAAYQAALSGRKRLIIGRKGSGKSAICVTLASATWDGQATSLVTPDDMSAEEIRQFELEGIRPERSKELIWRYMLGVQAAKYVVDHAHREHPKSVPGSVDALRKFLLANGEADDFKLHEKFYRVIQRLRSSLSLEAFGAKVSLEIQAPSEGLRTASELEVVEKNVVRALTELGCATKHGGLLLLVDQIEKVWSNDPESDAMVIGLLLAAKQVTSRFPGVRCVIFLRSDIYDLLQFGERDKFRGDEMRIDWNASSLQDLLLARAQASLGRDVTSAELWGKIFPATVDWQPMGEYLVRHTLMRPRDIIQFANHCRDVAEQHGHAEIHESDADEALVQYSAWKLQDLAGEYAVNYPFLGRLFPLFEDAGYLVLRAALERRVEPLLVMLRPLYPQFADALTVDGVIDILFSIGFLGVDRKKCQVYSYEQQIRVEPKDNEFYVHPCFRRALRADSATDVSPYQTSLRVGRALRQVGGGGLPGDVAVRPGRSFRLLQVINRSCERILEGLAAAQLPRELREEIAGSVTRMLRDTNLLASSDDTSSQVVMDHAHWIREFMIGLAQQLNENGLTADGRVQLFARTIDREADRLREAIGGWSGESS